LTAARQEPHAEPLPPPLRAPQEDIKAALFNLGSNGLVDQTQRQQDVMLEDSAGPSGAGSAGARSSGSEMWAAAAAAHAAASAAASRGGANAGAFGMANQMGGWGLGGLPPRHLSSAAWGLLGAEGGAGPGVGSDGRGAAAAGAPGTSQLGLMQKWLAMQQASVGGVQGLGDGSKQSTGNAPAACPTTTSTHNKTNNAEVASFFVLDASTEAKKLLAQQQGCAAGEAGGFPALGSDWLRSAVAAEAASRGPGNLQQPGLVSDAVLAAAAANAPLPPMMGGGQLGDGLAPLPMLKQWQQMMALQNARRAWGENQQQQLALTQQAGQQGPARAQETRGAGGTLGRGANTAPGIPLTRTGLSGDIDDVGLETACRDAAMARAQQGAGGAGAPSAAASMQNRPGMQQQMTPQLQQIMSQQMQLQLLQRQQLQMHHQKQQQMIHAHFQQQQQQQVRQLQQLQQQQAAQTQESMQQHALHHVRQQQHQIVYQPPQQPNQKMQRQTSQQSSPMQSPMLKPTPGVKLQTHDYAQKQSFAVDERVPRPVTAALGRMSQVPNCPSLAQLCGAEPDLMEDIINSLFNEQTNEQAGGGEGMSPLASFMGGAALMPSVGMLPSSDVGAGRSTRGLALSAATGQGGMYAGDGPLSGGGDRPQMAVNNNVNIRTGSLSALDEGDEDVSPRSDDGGNANYLNTNLSEESEDNSSLEQDSLIDSASPTEEETHIDEGVAQVSPFEEGSPVDEDLDQVSPIDHDSPMNRRPSSD